MRYIYAIAACFTLFVFYAIIGSVLGWKSGGGAIPMAIFYGILIFTWSAIIKNNDRKWKLISQTEAEKHSLYGVKNWLAVFAFSIVLSPIYELATVNTEVQKVGISLGQFFSLDVPAVNFVKLVIALEILITSIILWFLFSKHPKFRLVTSCILLSVWPLIALIGMANKFPELGPILAMSLFQWVAYCVLWITYLQRSKRVRVTFEHCVLSTENISDDVCINRDDLYKKAYEEMNSGQFEPASWAKAFANAEGNQDKAKALYIQYRVAQLATSEAKTLQVTLAKADILAQPESKASTYKENRGLVITIAIVGLVSVGLLVSQIQKPSVNSPQTTQAQTPQPQPVVQAQTPQPQPVVQAQTPQPQKLLTPFEEMLQKANAGDVEAQFVLGKMYNNGKDITLDYAQAAWWYRKAADQGNHKAQFNLGLLYYNGQGVPIDYAQSAYWFRKAADQGYADGQHMVGAIYYKGQGVPQDYAQAAYWFRKAANNGDSDAQLVLGSMYDTGKGALQDYSQAVYWYRKSADQGNSKAQLNLGLLYYMGQGVPKDYAQAVYWLRKAADQDDVRSQFFLGLMYFAGQGVPPDDAQAAYWYRRAANNGDSEAQYTLGTMYTKGQGISQDYSQAANWYLKAAEQRHAKAQLQLGLLYGSGMGIVQDDMTALTWLYISHFCSEGTPFREEISQVLSQINTKYTQQKITEAQQRANAWLVAHPNN